MSSSVSSNSARGRRTSALSDAVPPAAGVAWARSSSTQPISEESGVPSWCAVSRASPTQMVRFSACWMPRSPSSPSASSSTTPAAEMNGIQRRRTSTAGSP